MITCKMTTGLLLCFVAVVAELLQIALKVSRNLHVVAMLKMILFYSQAPAHQLSSCQFVVLCLTV